MLVFGGGETAGQGGRKRPSMSKAAENIQSRLIASFKSVRKRGAGEHVPLERYVLSPTPVKTLYTYAD
jgi:hypothetical protein